MEAGRELDALIVILVFAVVVAGLWFGLTLRVKMREYDQMWEMWQRGRGMA